MKILDRLKAGFFSTGTKNPGDSETGQRATHESSIARMYDHMHVDPARLSAVLDIRSMDKLDPRIKRIHSRTARAAVKGGLCLETTVKDDKLQQAYKQFVQICGLNAPQKLESDLRALMIEGNLAIQWVINKQRNGVSRGIRMPSETISPNVNQAGQFKDPKAAYKQVDLGYRVIAQFALWQLTLIRLDPENHDDAGSMGRPYLDATRSTWKKLDMTETDLVVRRRSRAPLKMHHSLSGYSEPNVEKYRERIEQSQMEGAVTDYYTNTKDATVNPIEGDAKLAEIADVVYLLDTMFAGAPAPKGLFGYVDGLNRDILEDMKRDFFDELDALQDSASLAYEHGFRLHLLLQGIDPQQYEFSVRFKERRTETLNQAADRALKYTALGTSRHTAWVAAGIDPVEEIKRRDHEANSTDPYPDDDAGPGSVKITPGNRPKGESATSVSNS